MNRRHTLATRALRAAAWIAPLVCALAAQPARAQDNAAPWSQDRVVRAVVARSPEVRAALIDLQRADLGLTVQEESFVTSFNASLGYTDGARAQLTPTGVRLINNTATSSSLGLARTFITGTQLSATASFDRSVQDSAATGLLGTTWGTDLRLTLTQPLLRGRGAQVNGARIETARLQSQALLSTRDRTASALLRDTLTTWWELWYAQQALHIREQALQVARDNLALGEQRVQAGVLAQDDLLPLLTEIASGEEAIASAQATVRDRGIALARRLGLPLHGTPPLADGDPTLRPLQDLDGLEDRVEDRAPELREAQATLDAARIDLITAQDQQRVRLDASAWAQLSGVGDDVGGAFEQLATLDSRTLFVGLTLQMPLSNAALDAEAQRTRLAIDNAEARLQSTREQLRADAAAQANTLRAAHQRLALADRTADLSRASTRSQQKRLQAGTTTPFEVVRTLQQQREAELRALRLRVDIVNAQLNVDHLEGQLLARLGVDLDATPR